MPISQKSIDKLKRAWKKSYGKNLTNEQALEIAGRLRSLVEFIAQNPTCTQEKSHDLDESE